MEPAQRPDNGLAGTHVQVLRIFVGRAVHMGNWRLARGVVSEKDSERPDPWSNTAIDPHVSFRPPFLGLQHPLPKRSEHEFVDRNNANLSRPNVGIR